MLIRSGLGVSFGVVFSVLLFKRRAWPAFVGLGFGAGRAWEECDNVSFPQCNMCYESDSVLTTANSPSSERQHLQKTASVLSDHRRYFTCERGYGTIPFCGFDALHAKYALYNRAWYRTSGQFKAVHLDLHCFISLFLSFIPFYIISWTQQPFSIFFLFTPYNPQIYTPSLPQAR